MPVFQLVQSVIVELHMVKERLFRDGRQGVCPELDLSILVGFNVLQGNICKIQDFLVAAVVYRELIGGKGVGIFQNVQCSGVGCTEFVERLTAIRDDAYLERNSTNFLCFDGKYTVASRYRYC